MFKFTNIFIFVYTLKHMTLTHENLKSPLLKNIMNFLIICLFFPTSRYNATPPNKPCRNPYKRKMLCVNSKVLALSDF